ncbi:hypothetical protein [Actinomadura sp. 9N215]|uniref:hypothetical protein n=1 Tax=Actinomadura sp. 9N215 TaxID=3375150 RepID=UPI0037B76D2E
MSPDELTVDTWYQVAVLRVYEPWLRMPRLVPDGERSRATGRVENARLRLGSRDVEAPFPLPSLATVVAFNQKETPQ